MGGECAQVQRPDAVPRSPIALGRNPSAVTIPNMSLLYATLRAPAGARPPPTAGRPHRRGPEEGEACVVRKSLRYRNLCASGWCWVRANRPGGDLSGLSNGAIETAARWTGKRGALMAALAPTWLDGEEGGIHRPRLGGAAGLGEVEPGSEPGREGRGHREAGAAPWRHDRPVARRRRRRGREERAPPRACPRGGRQARQQQRSGNEP